MNEVTFISKKKVVKVNFSNNLRELLLIKKISLIEQRILVYILSLIKVEQSKLIEINSVLREKRSMDDKLDEYFEGIANTGVVGFILSFKDLNFKNNRMRNEEIQKALINMSNVTWFRFKDNDINGFQVVPFILKPRWNKKNIFFYMDKEVLRSLLNMHKYTDINFELPYNAKSANTLPFGLWLEHISYNKDQKEISYNNLLKELYIPVDKYDGKAKFERDYLKRVKAELDVFNEKSFNYEYIKGTYYFTFYKTNNQDKGVFSNNLDRIKIERTLKYLKNFRRLDSINLAKLRSLFLHSDFEQLNAKIKRKIPKKILNDDFVARVFEEYKTIS